MIRYIRGSKIVIETIFYDSTGGVAFPTSAHLTVAYPTGSSSATAWPLSGDELDSTTGISMTTGSTDPTAANYGVWTSTWNSAIAGKGIVYWTAVPTTETLTFVTEGKFELRGGLASSAALATTYG